MSTVHETSRPGRQRREFRRTVARARPTLITDRPPRSRQISVSSSSRTTFLATGLWFLFLTRLTSILTFMWLRESLLHREKKLGAGCTRITGLGPLSGCRPRNNCVRASRRVSCFSSRIKEDAIKDVVHSRRTKIR